MMLTQKTALITGATGTIGMAIAAAFAREGCRLVLVGRDAEQLKKVTLSLVSSVSIETFVAHADDPVATKELMSFVERTYGCLDILITAAGTFGEIGTIEQSDPDRWLDAFRVNVLGTMMAIKYALPLLKKSSRGTIITFAGGGEGPFPRFSSYASSKNAVLRLTETAAVELEPFGISVNAISPGSVASGLREEIIAAGEERAGAEKFAMARGLTQEQTVSPDRAAELALFLASEKSSGLTGKNISAVWDRWKDIPKHMHEIMQSDIYTLRRIKPKDRGYDW